MYVRGNLGQDDSGDQFSINIPQTTFTLPTLPAGYSNTGTFTGLPVAVEIGLGLAAAFLLFRVTQKTTRRVSAGVRAARRAK
jgi:hypothetical protein